MDTDQILDEINELSKSATKVPGFRGKIMIDSGKLDAIYGEIKEGLPADLQEARSIILQKDSIINQAELQAKRLKEEAAQSAVEIDTAASQAHSERVSDSEVLKEANTQGDSIKAAAAAEAQNIVREAQRKAYTITTEAESYSTIQREGADRYSMEVLAGLEEKMSEILGQVRRGMDSLRVDETSGAPRNGITI